jgi:xylulokinase
LRHRAFGFHVPVFHDDDVVGTAWITAIGLGEISLDDVPGLVKLKQRYQPIPGHRAAYDECFANFVDIYRRMKSLYRRMN